MGSSMLYFWYTTLNAFWWSWHVMEWKSYTPVSVFLGGAKGRNLFVMLEFTSFQSTPTHVSRKRGRLWHVPRMLSIMAMSIEKRGRRDNNRASRPDRERERQTRSVPVVVSVMLSKANLINAHTHLHPCVHKTQRGAD